MLTDKWLRRQYVGYNREYFHDTLPPKLPVRFGLIRDKKIAAVTMFMDGQAVEIIVDRGLRNLPRYVNILVLHEMAHVGIGNKEKQYHGPLWRKERKRLLDAGAFTRLI